MKKPTRMCAEVRRHGARGGRGDGTRMPPLRGFLTALPRAGAPMILYWPGEDGKVARLITSLVDRVLMDPNGRDLYVETRQSVYRVTLDEPVLQLGPASPRPGSFAGFERTVAPDAPGDHATGEADSKD